MPFREAVIGSVAAQPELPFEEFVAEKDDNRRLEWVLATLPDGPLLRYLREPRLGHRDEYPVEVLWRCVVAKFVYQIKTYAELVRELWRNGSLRRVVGLEGSIPRDYHFSRLLKRLSSPVGRRQVSATLPEASASRSSRALAWACCRATYSGGMGPPPRG